MRCDMRPKSESVSGKLVLSPCYRHTELPSRAQGELPGVSWLQLERDVSETITKVGMIDTYCCNNTPAGW